MSAEAVRKLLGSIQEDPENENTWNQLEEAAMGGELASLGAEGAALLEHGRRTLLQHGEAEAASRLLDVEAVATESDPPRRAAVLRERARVLEDELFDDKAAMAALEPVKGSDAEAAEMYDRLGRKKEKWKELVAAFRQHAQETPDPAQIASHLASAAGVILQYKGKGRDKDVDTLFEQALSVDPGNVRAILLYERILRKRGEAPERIVDHIESFATKVTDKAARVAMLLRTARIHAGKRRDLGAAEGIYRHILSLDPENPDANRFLVVLLQAPDRVDDLVALYEKQLGFAANQGDVGLIIQVAMTHWRMRNDPASAANFFARLAQVAPEHPLPKNFFAENPQLAGESAPASAAADEETTILVEDGGEAEISIDETQDEPAPPVAPTPTAVVETSVAASEPEPPAPVVASEPSVEAAAPAPVVEEPPPAEPVAPTPPAVVEAPVAAKEPEPVATPEPEPVTSALPPPATPVKAAEPQRSNSVPSMIPPPLNGGEKPSSARVAMAIDLAEQAELSGSHDKSIDAWKAVLRVDPMNRRGRESLARIYGIVGRWNNVVELYRQELDALGGAKPNPEAPPEVTARKLEVLREMVKTYRDRMGLEPMVVQTYNAILAIEPGDLETLGELAKSYEKLGRWSDLIKVLEAQAEHTADPVEKTDLLRRVARLWTDRFNNANNAAKPLEQILAIEPTNAEAIRELKDLYSKRRAWRPLFEVLRKEAATLEGDAKRDALVEVAKLAAEKLNSAPDAIAVWREALAIDAKTPGALDALEKLTEREKDYAGLAEVLERRATETTDAEARVNVLMKLGAVYGERLNDSPKSINAWKRVLDAKPGHPKALRVLREAYTTAGDWDSLEGLYADAGDYEGLVDVLGTAADRAEDPVTRIALSFRGAAIYENQLQQPARAFRSYERVLVADPKNLRAAQALVPIYLSEEKWARLAAMYEVLLDALTAENIDGQLELLEKLRELNSTRLNDRAAAFRWALRAYKLRPSDAALESALERTAADAGAWRELVATLDARGEEVKDDAAEVARLRDKVAAIEADRLDQLDAAIARYQSVVGAGGRDPNVVETLDRLLRRGAKWAELRALFDTRLADASDASARRALLLEVAELEETQLEAPDAAAARYRAMLEIDSKDAAALEALSRLAEQGSRWEELAGLIAQRRDEAAGSVRGELALKLGELRLGKLNDPDGASASFREVLELSPHHPAALAALETLLRDEARRVVAAKLLEPEFAAVGESRKLAWVMQILLDASKEAEERKSLALRLARVYGEQLGDVHSGFDLLRQTIAEQPAESEVADELEALASRGDWNEELAKTYSEIVDREGLAPEVKIAIARRAATVYDDRLRRSEAAEPFHKIVAAGPELDTQAFGRLKALYQERERWADLRTLYATWVERTNDLAGKIELLNEEAVLVEEILDQPDAAIDVYKKIHDLDPTSRTALRPLDRLYTRQKRWAELAGLFTTWLDLAPEDLRDLRFRRGEVYERELNEFEKALDDYEAVVNDDPMNAGSRAGLERLVANQPALRFRAAAILERLYESDGDKGAADFVRMLTVRLENTSDAAARAELFRRIAELRELVLDDSGAAFRSTIDAFLAAPLNEAFRADLLRLAEASNQNAAAAEALEKAASMEEAKPGLQAILRDAAKLYDERLGDLRKAEGAYRRLLDASEEDPATQLECATALERIYQGLGDSAGLVRALELRAKLENDSDLRRELFARMGELQETELKDNAGAVNSHRARLQIDPSDRGALKALARLYESAQQWSQLVEVLESDAALASDATEQKALQLRAAQTLEAKLTDVDGSIKLYADVLANFGPDRAVHAALARLYELADKWTDLLDIVERDLQITESQADRLSLIVRAAELRRTKTNELPRAVEGYQEAVSIEPTQATARAALDGLLTNDDREVAHAAGRALAPVLEAESSWERLVVVLDRIAATTDDEEEKRRSLARAAEVCEVGLNDPARAFTYASRELQLSLSETDLRPRLDHLERLALAANQPAQHAEVLKTVAPDLLDADLQIEAFMKVATIARDRLNDRETARQYFEKSLDQRVDYAPALDALESLHRDASAWPELLDVLRRKTDLAVADSERRELLRKTARVNEEKLTDRPAAARAYESILELGDDEEASHALERIYAAEARWSDLQSLLENQLALPRANPVELHHRLGVVAAKHLDDADRALDHYREVLSRQADHTATVSALEELGQREGFAARTAEMLEPIYRSRMDWPKFIAAREARVSAETDVQTRKELLTQLGGLYEEGLGDLEKALDTFARVFREDIADRGGWDLVTRLAKLLGRHDKQAKIYAESLEAVSLDDDVTAELSFQTAQLFDKHVGDAQRARTFYRRALAFDPTREEVFKALESLLQRENAHTELLALYTEAAQQASDPETQKRFYFLIAEIQEKHIDDLSAAIDTYRQVLDVDPVDARATENLDRLYQRTQRWNDLADLLDRRIVDATESRERNQLRYRLGRLRFDTLGDPNAAIDAFEAIVQENSSHAEAIKALESIADAKPELRPRVVEILDPLYRGLDDWPKLIVVLNVRLNAATDAAERGQILREIANIKELRAKDLRGAFEAYSAAFVTDPGDGEAREQCERLAREHHLWDDLVKTYEGALAKTDDVIVKTDLLKAIAETHDQRRDDPRAAIEAYERLFALDETQVEALDQLQGLHVLLSDWEGLVSVLERKVERSMDDDTRKSLLHEIGEYQRDMLDSADKAIDAFKRAHDIDPGNAFALAALDDLYVTKGKNEELAEVLRQRIEIETESDDRKTLGLRLGELWEKQLDNQREAIDAYRRVLDDAPNELPALAALDRLYTATNAHNELLENLMTQAGLATDEKARNALRLRIGALQAGELSDSAASIETYREVLAVESSNETAIAAVKALSKNDGQRADAVAILEPIFRQYSRWDELVEVLELKIPTLDDPMAKRDELRGLADVHTRGRNDAEGAFDAYRRALHEDPSHQPTIEDLERLAAAGEKWAALAAIYEDEASTTSDPAVTRDLAVRAARIAEDRLKDDTRAVASFRQALSQGDDDEILKGLDRIYARGNQWRDVIDVLERRAALATDANALDALDVRIAGIKERELNDQSGALGSFRTAIERTPTNAEALAGVERLLENPATRADAMDLLEQSYGALDNTQKLAWLLSLKVQAADLTSEKVRLLGDLARLREERLQDAGGAFDAMVEAFKLDPREEQSISEIERLAPVANAWPRTKGVIEAAIEQHRADLDGASIAALELRAARWYRDQLQLPAAAEERLRAALAADAENAEALEMLEQLHRAEGREADLVKTLERRAEVDLDVTNRKKLLREAASLAEKSLSNVDLAATLTAKLLESDDADLEALELLARLRGQQNRNEDVADLLSKRARLVDDTALATQLRRQVAELYAGPINDANRAVTAYRELLEFDPADNAARRAVEDIFERTGRFKDLEESLRQRIDVAVSAEERNETRLRLAKLSEEKFKNISDAVDTLRSVLEETPTHPQAGAELERLFAQAKRWSDLSELLERRAQDSADAGDTSGELSALVRIGELNERELKNTSKAIELYQRVLERDANNVGALSALARLHEQDKQWDRAAEMLARAVTLVAPGPEGAAVALQLASIRGEKLNDEAGAEQALRRAVELEAKTLPALEKLKAIATKRNDQPMLAEMLEREAGVTTEGPKRVTLYKTLATIAREKLNDPSRAAGYLEKAREDAPDDRDLMLPLVDAYIAAGRQRDAVPVIEKIIASYGTKRSKDLATWHHRLGQALEALGDTTGALAQFDAAFKIDLTNVQILRDLGMLCYKTGDLDRAQKTFRALLLQRLDANSGITKADVYFYLGDTLRQQNDIPKAVNMLERAVEADKTHAKAVELLAKLKGG